VILHRQWPADHDAVLALHRAAFAAAAPGCYRRFGFRCATELGVTAPEPAWGKHFQARRLGGRPVGGAFRYADPFTLL
jgi:putative acetyltransferase